MNVDSNRARHGDGRDDVAEMSTPLANAERCTVRDSKRGTSCELSTSHQIGPYTGARTDIGPVINGQKPHKLVNLRHNEEPTDHPLPSRRSNQEGPNSPVSTAQFISTHCHESRQQQEPDGSSVTVHNGHHIERELSLEEPGLSKEDMARRLSIARHRGASISGSCHSAHHPLAAFRRDPCPEHRD